jgi:hypothetical protein
MNYLVFANNKDLEAARKIADEKLELPEDLDSMRWAGGGIHAPKEIGRRMTVSDDIELEGTDQYALMVTTGEFKKFSEDVKSAVVFKELPVDQKQGVTEDLLSKESLTPR